MKTCLDYFSDKKLDIDLTNDEKIRIKGLSLLPGGLKDQVLEYAQNNKREILIDLGIRDGVIPCPARCKRSGKFYRTVWFTGKPGKAMDCIPDQCPWKKRLKERLQK